MDTLLLFASSQKWFLRALFTSIILILVYLLSLTIDYVLALSGSSVDKIKIRGGIFLVFFVITVVVSSVFSKGHHYRSPAIALLVVFMFQTLVIFSLISLSGGSDMAKMIIFPIVYTVSYFVYEYRDLLNLYVSGILNRGKYVGRSNRTLSSAMQYSITAPLIGKGLKFLALLYTAYSIIYLSYVYYRDIEFASKTTVSKAIILNGDFDFVSAGLYFMDAITLYFIVILIGGISRSIREDKVRNAILQ